MTELETIKSILDRLTIIYREEENHLQNKTTLWIDGCYAYGHVEFEERKCITFDTQN